MGLAPFNIFIFASAAISKETIVSDQDIWILLSILIWFWFASCEWKDIYTMEWATDKYVVFKSSEEQGLFDPCAKFYVFCP